MDAPEQYTCARTWTVAPRTPAQGRALALQHHTWYTNRHTSQVTMARAGKQT